MRWKCEAIINKENRPRVFPLLLSGEDDMKPVFNLVSDSLVESLQGDKPIRDAVGILINPTMSFALADLIGDTEFTAEDTYKGELLAFRRALIVKHLERKK